MNLLSPQTLGFIVALLMAVTIIFVRVRAAKKPVSTKKILLPPVMMSTGFYMFHFPETITPLTYDLIAFLVGAVFSIPLILSSKFEVVGKDVYLKRSKTFFFVLLTLLVIRMIAKVWVEDTFTLMQTAGLFFVLAFGMIVPWRIAMLIMYRQLVKNLTLRT